MTNPTRHLLALALLLPTACASSSAPAILDSGSDAAADSRAVDSMGVVDAVGDAMTGDGSPDASADSTGEALTAVAAPVLTPPGGTYMGPVTVTMDCATPGATIYFSTDGSTPTTSSTRYSAPITLKTSRTTFRAFAAKDGMTPSAVVVAVYDLSMF